MFDSYWFSQYLGQEPSGGCPKCRLYVEDGCKGVLCTGCQAYWHYECAGVNDEILENEWNGVEFQCSLHKTTVSTIKSSNQKNIGMLFSDVRIKGFNLNVKEKLKDKLQNIDSKLNIENNDRRRRRRKKKTNLFLRNCKKFTIHLRKLFKVLQFPRRMPCMKAPAQGPEPCSYT